jgi:hypothetical protein
MGCPPPTTQHLPDCDSDDSGDGDDGDDKRLDLISMPWNRWDFPYLRAQLKMEGKQHEVAWKEFRRQYRDDINSVNLRAIQKSRDAKRSHKKTLKIARKQIRQQAGIWNRFKGALEGREDLSYWLVIREIRRKGTAVGFPDEQPTPHDGFKQLERKLAVNTSDMESSDRLEGPNNRKPSKSAPVRKKARTGNTVKDSNIDTSALAATTKSAGRTNSTAPTIPRKYDLISVKSSTPAAITGHTAAVQWRERFVLRRMALDLEEREFELKVSQQDFFDKAEEYRRKYGVEFNPSAAK